MQKPDLLKIHDLEDFCNQFFILRDNNSIYFSRTPVIIPGTRKITSHDELYILDTIPRLAYGAWLFQGSLVFELTGFKRPELELIKRDRKSNFWDKVLERLEDHFTIINNPKSRERISNNIKNNMFVTAGTFRDNIYIS